MPSKNSCAIGRRRYYGGRSINSCYSVRTLKGAMEHLTLPGRKSSRPIMHSALRAHLEENNETKWVNSFNGFRENLAPSLPRDCPRAKPYLVMFLRTIAKDKIRRFVVLPDNFTRTQISAAKSDRKTRVAWLYSGIGDLGVYVKSLNKIYYFNPASADVPRPVNNHLNKMAGYFEDIYGTRPVVEFEYALGGQCADASARFVARKLMKNVPQNVFRKKPPRTGAALWSQVDALHRARNGRLARSRVPNAVPNAVPVLESLVGVSGGRAARAPLRPFLNPSVPRVNFRTRVVELNYNVPNAGARAVPNAGARAVPVVDMFRNTVCTITGNKTFFSRLTCVPEINESCTGSRLFELNKQRSATKLQSGKKGSVKRVAISQNNMTFFGMRSNVMLIKTFKSHFANDRVREAQDEINIHVHVWNCALKGNAKPTWLTKPGKLYMCDHGDERRIVQYSMEFGGSERSANLTMNVGQYLRMYNKQFPSILARERFKKKLITVLEHFFCTGVTHQDIHPANILVVYQTEASLKAMDSNVHLKLIDFGNGKVIAGAIPASAYTIRRFDLYVKYQNERGLRFEWGENSEIWLFCMLKYGPGTTEVMLPGVVPFRSVKDLARDMGLYPT